jgi:hypothetical protein
MLELRGGLPIGWEALWPSEPLHSHDKATHSNLQNMVCVLISTIRGIFIGSWGSFIDLEKSVWCQVVAGWPSHVAGQPGGAATTDVLHGLGLLLLM